MSEATNIIREELEALKQRIIENHRRAGQVASGRTIRSMKVTMRENGGMLTGRQAFGTLETGRKAGRTPYNFTDIIKQWIIDKGISVSPIQYKRQASENWQPKYTPQERGLNTMAGAIAHKIQTEGTRLYRNGGRSDIYSNEIPRAVENIQKRVLSYYTTEVETININAANENSNI